VATVAHASALSAVSAVVVAVNGVESDVDLSGVVAPLVVDVLLVIPMVVGAPLVPCVVNPLVVALALMALSSVVLVAIALAVAGAAIVLVLSTVGSGLVAAIAG